MSLVAVDAVIAVDDMAMTLCCVHATAVLRGRFSKTRKTRYKGSDQRRFAGDFRILKVCHSHHLTNTVLGNRGNMSQTGYQSAIQERVKYDLRLYLVLFIFLIQSLKVIVPIVEPISSISK